MAKFLFYFLSLSSFSFFTPLRTHLEQFHLAQGVVVDRERQIGLQLQRQLFHQLLLLQCPLLFPGVQKPKGKGRGGIRSENSFSNRKYYPNHTRNGHGRSGAQGAQGVCIRSEPGEMDGTSWEGGKGELPVRHVPFMPLGLPCPLSCGIPRCSCSHSTQCRGSVPAAKRTQTRPSSRRTFFRKLKNGEKTRFFSPNLRGKEFVFDFYTSPIGPFGITTTTGMHDYVM